MLQALTLGRGITKSTSSESGNHVGEYSHYC